MKIELDVRTEETVRIYFEKSQNPIIKKMLPQKAQSVEEALEDYRETILPTATSYGRIICVDGEYVGDVWCYCIDADEEPNAMLSYCVFEEKYWNKGIATKAVSLFLEEVKTRFQVETVGAFFFSENQASQKILEKNGFAFVEEFEEDGVMSKYYQRTF